MHSILDNVLFVRDYHQLKEIQLNPEKHLAKNAFEHTEQVVKMAIHLAQLNNLSSEETETIVNWSYVHDIGKITGTANPSASVELLAKYGISDESFINLVKYHDSNLPWFISAQKGEVLSDKAWKKMASKLNLKILCLFMIADRVDCPGGWKCNTALCWFLDQVKRQNLLNGDFLGD